VRLYVAPPRLSSRFPEHIAHFEGIEIARAPASLPVPLKNVWVSALAVPKKGPNPRENPVSFAIIYDGGNFESLTLHQITRDG